MKVKVDPNLCIGCGLCVSTAPGVFRINTEGKAEPVTGEGDPDLIKQAVSDCPVQAISQSEG